MTLFHLVNSEAIEVARPVWAQSREQLRREFHAIRLQLERMLFNLDWLQSVQLRRRVNTGLNKGEARNAMARAVFYYRLCEIRDRSFEQQRYRASNLNLITAVVVLWNTIYLKLTTSALRGHGKSLDDSQQARVFLRLHEFDNRRHIFGHCSGLTHQS